MKNNTEIFCQQEIESIIDQMMTVAEYIGWETDELRPVRILDLYHLSKLYSSRPLQ